MTKFLFAVLAISAVLCAQPRPVAPGQIQYVSGSGNTLVTTTGTPVAGHGVVIDANGNFVDSGSTGGAGQFRNVLVDGAVCDGTTSSTSAFTAALTAAKYVVVPECALGFVVAGFSIPANTTLHLLPGALIKTSGTIQMNAANAQLLGHTSGIASVTGASGYNVLWTGATNGVIVGVGESGTPTGVSVNGISVHGADTVGVVGFRFGQGNSLSWSKFVNLSALHVGTGYHVVAAMQQCHMEWIIAMDYSVRGIYIEGNAGVGGAITTLFIDHWTVESPQVSPSGPAIDIGGAAGNGASHVVISNGVMEIESGQVGVNLAAGGPYEIFSNYFEGVDLTTTSFVIGRASGFAFLPNIFANTIQGSGTHFNMKGWRNPRIHDNYIGNYTGETVFLRTGGGLYTFGGRWVDNQLDGGLGTEVSGGTAGFDLFIKENPNSSTSIPAPNYGFASTATLTPPTMMGDVAVTGAIITTPASGDAATFNGRVHIAAGAGADLFQFTGSNGDAYIDMNSAQHLFFRTVQAATSGTTARNSPVWFFRGARWTGSASASLDASVTFKPNATIANSRIAFGYPDVNDQMLNIFYSGGMTLGNTTDPGPNNLNVTGTIQGGVTPTDPGCTTTAHISKQWFDTTTTTTAYKVCLNVAGTLTWVTK